MSANPSRRQLSLWRAEGLRFRDVRRHTHQMMTRRIAGSLIPPPGPSAA